ncbi:MAG: hypothetical protein HQK50_07525 [Oligoflexia bacterium]|nr:hypothetical protein [Oligoflexia bacterium]
MSNRKEKSVANTEIEFITRPYYQKDPLPKEFDKKLRTGLQALRAASKTKFSDSGIYLVDNKIITILPWYLSDNESLSSTPLLTQNLFYLIDNIRDAIYNSAEMPRQMSTIRELFYFITFKKIKELCERKFNFLLYPNSIQKLKIMRGKWLAHLDLVRINTHLEFTCDCSQFTHNHPVVMFVRVYCRELMDKCQDSNLLYEVEDFDNILANHAELPINTADAYEFFRAELFSNHEFSDWQDWLYFMDNIRDPSFKEFSIIDPVLVPNISFHPERVFEKIIGDILRDIGFTVYSKPQSTLLGGTTKDNIPLEPPYSSIPDFLIQGNECTSKQKILVECKCKKLDEKFSTSDRNQNLSFLLSGIGCDCFDATKIIYIYPVDLADKSENISDESVKLHGWIKRTNKVSTITWKKSTNPPRNAIQIHLYPIKFAKALKEHLSDKKTTKVELGKLKNFLTKKLKIKI